MPRTCTICTHPEREDIERSLLAGEPYRHLASRTGTSTASLQRHKQSHLSRSIVKAHQAQEVLRADNVLDQVKRLAQRTERLYGEVESTLEKAQRSGDLRTALAAIREATNVIREARANTKLLAELTAQCQPADLRATPGWGPAIQVGQTIYQLSDLIGLPKTVPSVKEIELETEEFPELSEEELGLFIEGPVQEPES